MGHGLCSVPSIYQRSPSPHLISAVVLYVCIRMYDSSVYWTPTNPRQPKCSTTDNSINRTEIKPSRSQHVVQNFTVQAARGRKTIVSDYETRCTQSILATPKDDVAIDDITNRIPCLNTSQRLLRTRARWRTALRPNLHFFVVTFFLASLLGFTCFLPFLFCDAFSSRVAMFLQPDCCSQNCISLTKKTVPLPKCNYH